MEISTHRQAVIKERNRPVRKLKLEIKITNNINFLLSRDDLILDFFLFTKPHFQTLNAVWMHWKASSFLQAFQIISEFFSQKLIHKEIHCVIRLSEMPTVPFLQYLVLFSSCKYLWFWAKCLKIPFFKDHFVYTSMETKWKILFFKPK